MVQDYRIDYEEYYNRQMVGCVWTKMWDTFERNVGSWWYCTNFTTYWNWNSTDRHEKVDWTFATLNTWYHDLYYCTSESDIPTDQWRWSPVVVIDNYCGTKGTLQSSHIPSTLCRADWVTAKLSCHSCSSLRTRVRQRL